MRKLNGWFTIFSTTSPASMYSQRAKMYGHFAPMKGLNMSEIKTANDFVNCSPLKVMRIVPVHAGVLRKPVSLHIDES
jgi:hypothetical protein